MTDMAAKKRRFPAAVGLLVLFAALAGLPARAPAENSNARVSCGGAEPCPVGNRSYLALPPDDWNGRDALPVLIHFHGWGRTGANVIGNPEISGATREAGVLLLAPNGLSKSWSFWRAPSRDVPFVEAMVEDAARRFPIDRKRIYVSGFSYGAAMAWRLACERGADYAAFLPIAGTLWNFGELEHCSAPVRLRQVHGLADTVMDLPRGAGGDPLYAVSPWLHRNGCKTAPDKTERVGIFTESVWTSCASGRGVELDLHESGHVIPQGWMKRQLERLAREDAAG